MPLFSFFNLLTETTVNCRCPLQSLNWGYCKEKNAKSGFVKDIPWCPSPLVTSSTTCVCFCGNRQEDRWQTGGEECRQLNTWRDLVLARCLYPAAMPEMSLLKSGTAQTRWESYPRSFLLQQFNLDSKILMMKELFYNFSCCMRGEWSHRRWLWRGGIM